jgi:hypothetical protein
MTLLIVSPGNSSGGHPGEAGAVQEAREITSLSLIFQGAHFVLQKAEHSQAVVGEVKVKSDPVASIVV